LTTPVCFKTPTKKPAGLIRLVLFLGFSYIGMILALRSNKEDFSLVIPYVRFSPQNRPDNFLLLDTSVIIDGRIADLIEAKFFEGLIVVPRFVLNELQQVADSSDPVKRARAGAGSKCSAHPAQHRIGVKYTTPIFPRKPAWTPNSCSSRKTSARNFSQTITTSSKSPSYSPSTV